MRFLKLLFLRYPGTTAYSLTSFKGCYYSISSIYRLAQRIAECINWFMKVQRETASFYRN